ncbi:MULTISPECIES: hypothetical protein [Methylococcus]|uniref:Uncharacterized protein n=1 Tax=Methylococcus capsulatus TaxID=414 RepID=A0ABZ2F2Q0_METCP|nr:MULTISPECIES: hypothetical protein [Methylococcus]
MGTEKARLRLPDRTGTGTACPGNPEKSGIGTLRCPLRHRLDALRAGGWSLGSALADDGHNGAGIEAAEAEIESIDAELGQFGTNALNLDQSLDCITEVLGQSKKWLDTRPVAPRLDYRGIKLADFGPAAAGELQLTELFSATGSRRIILAGRIPKGKIPDRPNVVKELSRYLG